MDLLKLLLQYKRCTLSLLLFIGFSINCFATLAKSEVDHSNKALKRINKELIVVEKHLKIKTKRKAITKKNLGRVKSSLYKTKKSLYHNKKHLNQLEQKIKLNYNNIHRTKLQYNTIVSQLNQRLVYLYKSNQDMIYEKLFGSQSIQDSITQDYAYKKIFHADHQLLEQLSKTHQRLKDQEKTLHESKKQKKTILGKIRKNKTYLEKKNQDLSYKLAKLNKDISSFKEKQQALQRDSNEISSLILRSLPKKMRNIITGRFIKPAKGWISSRFGYRKHPIFKRRILHAGIDIAAPTGQEIRAANTGYVLFSGWKKGYGRVTILNHGFKNGKTISSVYAHQSRTLVKKNQWVQKGDLIGYVGKTGFATGPHLHFELRENGKPINPVSYVNF